MKTAKKQPPTQAPTWDQVDEKLAETAHASAIRLWHTCDLLSFIAAGTAASDPPDSNRLRNAIQSIIAILDEIGDSLESAADASDKVVRG